MFGVRNYYQHESRVLYRFVPLTLFGQLLEISPAKFVFLKIYNSDFSYIELWLTNRNSKPLEIEDRMDLT